MIQKYLCVKVGTKRFDRFMVNSNVKASFVPSDSPCSIKMKQVFHPLHRLVKYVSHST
uniref:Putative metal-nicotianamine transporter YSL6 n=1 Tax=Rhizophora mucronata TaxID=61149 RepID=A0A2P2MUD3_RHIMU